MGHRHNNWKGSWNPNTELFRIMLRWCWIEPSRISMAVSNYRRKFRSQTSDNMDRWKAEQGRGREKRKIRREKSRRERVRRKKMEMREKEGKSRFTVFFQWFVAPEGRKVGSLKRRVRSQLARGEMKNCTPLWREAHFQVKMYKTHHCRTTFGSCNVEKVHAVVARSTFRRQNVQNTPFSDHFWKLRCWKSARRCGAKHISKSKCTKHTMYGPFLEVQMSGARDCAACQKWAKREGFVAFPRMMAGMGHLKRICKDAFSWQAQYKRQEVRALISWEGLHFGVSDVQVC